MLKKILSVISASVIMMSAVNVSAETISEEYSRSYVLMEAETHTVIRENNGLVQQAYDSSPCGGSHGQGRAVS